jgi:predicted AlkP superfamily pyrophosphatase or phosphodiesterase
VIGVSIKDRSAILPAGHIANGAYWFDGVSGNFVSSTFYFPELPPWVQAFNSKRTADRYAGAQWKAFDSAAVFKTMPEKAGPALYGALEAAPFGNELIESFAEQAIDSEQLGHHPGTDLLTVSFSANDYVGHRVGPDDPSVRDISVLTDRLIGKLFSYVDSKIGLDNVIIVMTADHGVAPLPEVNAKRGMPGGRASASEFFKLIDAELVRKYGEGKWIESATGPIPYFNRALILQKKLNPAEVENTAAEAVRNLPHIFRVYTRDQIVHGQMPEDRFSLRVRNGFYPSRSGDLIIIPDAYWIFEPAGASHGTAFNYDTHVPVLFMGPNIKAGFYDGQIAVNDIAPTLATILSLEAPSGSVGRVLSEMLAR